MIIQSFVTPAHAKATYTNQIQPDQSELTIIPHTLCKPTLKHHQYKHHQQHKSININSILTGRSDDHPAVRHASTCESHIHKSNTSQPKRANHHGTYTLQTNTQTPSTTQINKHQSHTYSLQRRSSFLTIIQSFVASTHAKATYTNQMQPDQSEPTIMAHTLCKP